MIVTRKALPRRTLLRGIGATVSLPLLDAMVPAMTALAATPAKPLRRLAIVYIPMGSIIARWTPAEVGKITELSPTLSPLAPHLDRLLVLSGFELKNAYSAGNHATANSAFLSAAKAKMTEGSDYQLGTTMDQIAAQRIGRETPLPSLELAMDLLNTVGNCDNGFACVYQNCLSWSSPTTPLPAEAHPRVVFERLFGDGGTSTERRAELRKNASILDWVTEDMARLQRVLGAGDRTKIGQYLDTIREVERRIQRAEQRAADGVLPDLDRPAGVPAAYADHLKLMFDLQVLAFQADITRVITFQVARETSTRAYTEIGISEGHHPLTHNGNNPEMVAKVAQINRYHMSLFGYYLDRLKATVDGNGSLLDDMVVLCGSGMGNPDVHDHVNLPILVAGGAAGGLKGGRHIKYPEPTALANLHLALLDKVGVPLDSFADSTGKTRELVEPVDL